MAFSLTRLISSRCVERRTSDTIACIENSLVPNWNSVLLPKAVISYAWKCNVLNVRFEAKESKDKQEHGSLYEPFFVVALLSQKKSMIILLRVFTILRHL